MRIAVALALGVAFVAGCTPATPERERDEITTCEAGFSTPAGFRETEALEDPYQDHIGIRLGFRDETGREIHYFAGIPGEFGEGLPVRGTVPAAQGIDATLVGSGEIWVVSWRAPGPCGARAALGSGFTRRGFLDTLRGAAIIPA